jgi:chemotaxis signal transduction protein
MNQDQTVGAEPARHLDRRSNFVAFFLEEERYAVETLRVQEIKGATGYLGVTRPHTDQLSNEAEEALMQKAWAFNPR